jgi:hypothetical protein
VLEYFETHNKYLTFGLFLIGDNSSSDGLSSSLDTADFFLLACLTFFAAGFKGLSSSDSSFDWLSSAMRLFSLAALSSLGVCFAFFAARGFGFFAVCGLGCAGGFGFFAARGFSSSLSSSPALSLPSSFP